MTVGALCTFLHIVDNVAHWTLCAMLSVILSDILVHITHPMNIFAQLGFQYLLLSLSISLFASASTWRTL